jgi:hypothetical protein
MIKMLIWAIGIGILLIFFLLAYVLYAEVNKQKRPSYLPKKKRHKSSPRTQHYSDSERHLIRLVGGDRETAYRLAALEGGNWQAAIDKLIRDCH